MPSCSGGTSSGGSNVELSIVIVTYNSRDVIVDCLSAISASVRGAVQVVMVDNASTDDTVSIVRNRFPEVLIIEQFANGGFASGVVTGVGKAKADVICLLNPDAVVTSEVLLELTRRVSEDHSLGIVAPIVRNPNGRLQIVSAGHMPTLWRMFTHFTGISRLGGASRCLEGHYLFPNQVGASRDVEWVTGACIVFRADLWKKVGGISQRWFMYAEDIEFCWRVTQAGYRVHLYSDMVVSHLVGESTSDRDADIDALWVTNLFEFYESDLAGNVLERELWRLVVCLGLLSRSGAFLVRSLGSRGPWRTEAKKFFAYSAAIARKRHRAPESEGDL